MTEGHLLRIGNSEPKFIQLSSTDVAVPIGQVLHSAMKEQSQWPPKGKRALFAFLGAALQLDQLELALR